MISAAYGVLDVCHLPGSAAVGGSILYVSAHSRTDRAGSGSRPRLQMLSTNLAVLVTIDAFHAVEVFQNEECIDPDFVWLFGLVRLCNCKTGELSICDGGRVLFGIFWS